MLRLTEFALFLAPFAAFVVWRLMATEGGPSMGLVFAAAGALVLVAGLLFWLSREDALPPGTHYVPAQLQDGQVVPSHAAPR